MKKISLVPLFLLFSRILSAQSVTFSGQIASVVYNNCTPCHREGAIAPFALESYQDVFNYRYAIRDVINNQVMPPWSPNPLYSHFAGERTLSPAQIGMINQWIIDGAARGDAAGEPALPVFDDHAQMAQPDFSKTCEQHTVTKNTDDFEFFALQSDLSQDAFIKQIELVPGNKKIVHHIFVFIDSTGDFKNFMDKGDINLNGNNYISGGNMSMLKLIGGYLPGSNSFVVPENMGFRVPKHSWYILQVHYAPGSQGQSDATTLNVRYASQPVSRNMEMKPLLDNAVNLIGTLYIPANTTRTFMERTSLSSDISLIAITPHMHLIGKRLKVYAYDPVLKDTIRLVDDRWDFHWQGIYTFPKPVHLLSRDILYAEGYYDNTSNNHDNPFNPPQNISAGTSTLTEMMQVFFCYVPYKPGDENIVLGQSNYKPDYTYDQGYVYPNPATPGKTVSFAVDPSLKITGITISSIDGRMIRQYQAGYTTNKMDISLPQLANGMYVAEIQNSYEVIRKKFVVYNP